MIERAMENESSSSKTTYGKQLWALFCILVLPFVLFGAFFYLAMPGSAPRAKNSFGPTTIDGTFTAEGAALGDWKLAPVACLAGLERGFDGILFRFGTDTPVREIRLDSEREGDNTVEILFNEVDRGSVRVRERDCVSIQGERTIRRLQLNGRPMQRLEGWLSVSCPSIGLQGKVSYDGCLP
jgi:hypothetical protein